MTPPQAGWGKGCGPEEAIRFLEGPQPRGLELGFVLRIMRDLFRGLRTLHFVGPCVTVFGSARFGATHPHYAMARAVGRELARAGFTVMTGGGPGIMEAATLIQTRRIKDFPLVMMGLEYWEPLRRFIDESLVGSGTIDREDAARIVWTDSPADAVAMIRDRAMRQFGLTYGPRVRRRWLLGEWNGTRRPADQPAR